MRKSKRNLLTNSTELRLYRRANRITHVELVAVTSCTTPRRQEYRTRRSEFSKHYITVDLFDDSTQRHFND
uniref:Uncharacterized protein n=1 Tax=Parascaris univalens TaxID=6257 RepID=A0A915B168_PARUN